MPETLSTCTLCSSGRLHILDGSIGLCKCQECGFVFRNPRPSFVEIKDYYSGDEQYGSWLTAEEARNAMWRRRLRKIARHRTGGSLLDVGTGIGQFLNVARTTFGVAGTEVSESAVKIAAEKYGLALNHGRLEEIADTVFGQSQFDIVTVFHVLEHVPCPATTLAACRRVLVEGGLLVVAVPNDIDCWRRPLENLLRLSGVRRFRSRGMYGLQKLELNAPGREIHLSHFTTGTLETSLEREGFRILDMGLDPFYAAVGARGALHTGIYAACSMVRLISSINIYDAIWAVAEKVVT